MPEPRRTVETSLGELPGSVVGALAPHLRAISRRRRLVGAFALLALAAAIAFNLVRPAPFEAEGQITVTPRPPGDLTLGALPVVRATPGYPGRPTATVGAMIDTEQVAAEAAERLGESDADALFEAVEVKPDPDANVLIVTAPGDTAEQAAERVNTYMLSAVAVRREKLAPLVAAETRAARRTLRSLRAQRNAQAEFLRARIGELQSIADGTDPTFTITREASVPSGRAGLPLWMLLVAATLGGGLIGAGTAVLLRLLGPRSAGSEAELSEYFPAEVIGRVPALALSNPARIDSAYRSLRSRLAFSSGTERSGGIPGGLIVVTSGGRGDGRSSVVAGLARSIDAIGGAAAVVDLDLDGSRASWLGSLARPGEHPTHLADGFMATPALSGSFLITPGRSEQQSDMLIRRGRDLALSLIDSADCVIVDGPPIGEFADLLELARAADLVVVVGRVGHTDDRGAASLTQSFEAGGISPAGLVVLNSDRVTDDPAGPAAIGQPGGAHDGGRRRSASLAPVAYGGRRGD